MSNVLIDKPLPKVNTSDLFGKLKREVDKAFMTDDPIKRNETLDDIRGRAEEIRKKTDLERYIKLKEKDLRKARERGNNFLQASEFPEKIEVPDELKNKAVITSEWFVNYGLGVYKIDRHGEMIHASNFMVIPVERFIDIDDNTECMRIKYMRDNKWSELIVPREILGSATKVVPELSRYGLTDSEMAKSFVSYISRYEQLNEDAIQKTGSSKRLGWTKENTFIPYDENIRFNDNSFKALYESIHEHGSRDAWFSEAKRIRANGCPEIRFMMAAAFASPVLQRIGGLPFICDLWGMTEGGKSVTLKLCASIWANPSGGQYIGDFQNTQTAIEVKSAVLNNLPMMLDDSSKASSSLINHNGFETLIYTLCSGKGKSRSNKNLGVEKERTWCNIILTNGEKPLHSYANQGGAKNRIIELECQDEHFFPDPVRTVEVVAENYGFAGKEFINLLTDENIKLLKTRRDCIHREIMKNGGALEKQSMAAAVVIAVDEFLTEKLFCDGHGIKFNDIKKHLLCDADVSEGARCYDLLKDVVVRYADRFSDDPDKPGEKWGKVENLEEGKVVYILPTVLDEICKKNGFSKQQLIKWLDSRELIAKDKQGKFSILKKGLIEKGIPERFHKITLVDDPEGHKSKWVVPETTIFN